MQGSDVSPGRRWHRSGFTWIELIVSIGILALLAALLLPTIRNARGPARRTQCQSNLRNVGIAMHAYSTVKNGELPLLTGGINITSPGEVKNHLIPAPWSVVLLPYLEQSALYDRLKTTPARTVDEFDQLALTTIESYRCASALTPHAGGISYVANAGIIPADQWSMADTLTSHSGVLFDFGFNGFGGEHRNSDDEDAAYSAGVFWTRRGGEAKADAAPRPLNLDQISAHDGTSQTVLLSENLHTRSYDPRTKTGGWISNHIGDIAFGIAVPGTQEGDEFRVDLSSTAGGLGESGGAKETALKLSQSPVAPASQINSNLKIAVLGRSPRPSSLHAGSVTMAFADGSCRVISEKIEPSVYARLLSPWGGHTGKSGWMTMRFESE